MRATWVVLVLACGCLPRVPTQRLADRTPVAVAYVVDPEHVGEAITAPDELKRAVGEVFGVRNLDAAEVPLEALKGQRLTDARFEALKAANPTAPYVVLVELRVQFFSQLDGRYRWEVAVALTAAKRDGSASKDTFRVPVVLLYDREKEAAAIEAAVGDLTPRLGTLLDGVLIGQTAAVAGPHAIYFAMVDRFANGSMANDSAVDLADPAAFHGGDLQGLIDHLDWIQRFGFDTVWLSPLSVMRTEKWNGYGAFHGYWTWRLGELEPRFGDEGSLRRLSNEVHRRGMKLVLDVVLNHVGPGAPLLSEHPDWFHRQGGITDWNDERQLVERDVQGLPDLATEKPEVYGYLLSGARRWLRAGAT